MTSAGNGGFGDDLVSLQSRRNPVLWRSGVLFLTSPWLCDVMDGRCQSFGHVLICHNGLHRYKPIGLII